MCSVAFTSVPCAVWHLLMCHVLLTLISLVSEPGLLYHCKFCCYFTSTTLHLEAYIQHNERGRWYKWLVCHGDGVHSFFFNIFHEMFLEKLRKFPKFLRYDSQQLVYGSTTKSMPQIADLWLDPFHNSPSSSYSSPCYILPYILLQTCSISVHWNICGDSLP
jgi:hypothetical protein